MEFKAKFKFYAVEGKPYIGAYRCGTFKEGEPQIMFAMDFHTWTLKECPKEELVADFKDGILQTITHEFCHAMQEMLDKDYDELEVERIMGAYKPIWNTFDLPEDDPMPETVFKISDFLNWVDASDASSVEKFRNEINELFEAHRLWIEAERKDKLEKLETNS